jgi:hypothetical protein
MTEVPDVVARLLVDPRARGLLQSAPDQLALAIR